MDNDSLFPIVLKGVSKSYASKKGIVEVLTDIHLTIERGETIALIGRSGSGKSTLGRIVAGLEVPSKGTITLGTRKNKKSFRRKVQMIFQDHTAVLNPVMMIGDIIAEGIDIHGMARNAQHRSELVTKLLQDVGLPEGFAKRFPQELSGGQKQRVGIARALAVEPDIIICDEPLSALDLCTQEQILELLQDLKSRRQLTYLFITHDLPAIRGFADRVVSL